MKKVFLFAAAALMVACSSDDDLAVKDQSQPQLEKGAIGFDVYTQKATTRAGWAGSLTTAELKENDDVDAYAKANGFGVFGFYTDNNEYEQRSVPNFMYNQQVQWNSGGGYWEYDPVMYWPNEYGADATSDDADKVSFFAYAPYVKVIPTSGKVANTETTPGLDNTKELEAYGITGMTRNSNQGDPILKYIASFDNSKSVDLCWGVAPQTEWNTTQKGSDQEFAVGLPWLNVQRPAEAATQAAATQRVKFVFKHATAQLQVHIDADVNVDGRGHSVGVDQKTRVWVREVKFKGFAMKGSLNLNNETANKERWLDYNGQNEIVAEDVIVYDGRKDGKEGVSGAVATNEKVLGLNPDLVQDGLYRDNSGLTVNETGNKVYDNADPIKVLGVDNTTARPGVTSATVNLFDNEGINDYFHVIPVDNEKFEVEIVYDIETVDANLAQNLSDGATKGSSIENRISKSITFGTEDCLKAGHSYKLNLHLGMNSVKFDAAVTDWIVEAAQDVDLPLNAPQFAAGETYGEGTPAGDIIYLPYTAETNAYTFAITGLNGGESVTAGTTGAAKYNNNTGATATTTIAGFIGTSNNAKTNGYAIETVTTPVNPTTSNRTQIIEWTGKQSSKVTTFTFTQKAHPLELSIKTATKGTNTIELDRSDDITGAFGWFCQGLAGNCAVLANNDGSNYIKVWRNGILLTWEKVSGTPSANNKYTFGDESAVITIGDALQSGDEIVVELKTGDAPAETASFTVAP